MFFPRCCSGCGRAVGEPGRHLCWDCRAEFRPIAAPLCQRCGNPMEGRAEHAYSCWHCTHHPPRFELARSALRFEGVAAGLIRDFKYHRAFWLQEELVDLLEACVRAHYGEAPGDVLCPVPLHGVRARSRGFNQAALLAAGLARRLRLPCATRVVRRVRFTRTQTHLTASERLSNVAGAFSVRRPAAVRGKRWLLVDDVMTTGATVDACAAALLDAGALSVRVVTLARGQ